MITLGLVPKAEGLVPLIWDRSSGIVLIYQYPSTKYQIALISFHTLDVWEVEGIYPPDGNVFWDGGATIVLIRHGFAEELGLKGQEVIQRVQVCGREFEDWNTRAYWVVMIVREGVEHKMKALGIDTITSEIEAVEIRGVIHLLHVPLCDVERPHGPVDLLVGLNEAGLHPTGGHHKVGNLRLLQSQFGTGALLDGAHPAIKPKPVRITKLAHMVKMIDTSSPIPKSVKNKVNLLKSKVEKEHPEFQRQKRWGYNVPGDVTGVATAQIAVCLHSTLPGRNKPS